MPSPFRDTTTGTARAVVPAVTKRLRALTNRADTIAAGRVVHPARKGTLRRNTTGLRRRDWRWAQRAGR